MHHCTANRSRRTNHSPRERLAARNLLDEQQGAKTRSPTREAPPFVHSDVRRPGFPEAAAGGRRSGPSALTTSARRSSMKKSRLVFVGNGMAGVRTLEELLKIAPDLYEITVFGAEPHTNYNRILLSPVLAGEMTLQDIILNGRDWYESNGIRLHLGKKVVRIDRAA